VRGVVMDKEEKMKNEIRKKLEKIKMKQNDIEDLIESIQGLVEPEEKNVETNYGTSCLRLEKNGKMLTEF
jgi:transcriptional regulator NrdR family protein